MMQITEDTPPDMLAGAMDLTVHLPNGKRVKMSVERSTPMMDLLVQITTANHLQLSTHTLQVLGMAPSSEHSDKILPFKPNTPIGTLDTQHIRVLPKGKPAPPPTKFVSSGHQPFESTFRLKVHLPRNQLYVTRVSRNVLLEDIMKKVCEEKNLDPLKYDFKHPGHLDQVLDPKFTLSDYKITEIYVVAKGTTNLSQAFSPADIMVLRKEEERKQMHHKTGGGVFNLIFKKGKSSMGSGSVSSDNRSISPTQSDDSRSVTPPAVQAPPIVAPLKKDSPPDRPKPPQRKRRPAPKPPQIQTEEVSNTNDDKSSSVISNEPAPDTSGKKTSENGLTICHSRNSSDSSGYHEASILSEHCANASLPRPRPKSAFVSDLAPLQSTSNLNKMSAHSRSTTSLVTGRKKKAAPPPPPVAVSPASSVVAHAVKPSPLVASQSDNSTPPEFHEVSATTENPSINLAPIPKPRNKAPRAPLRPRPNSEIFVSSEKSCSVSNRLSYNEDIIEQVEKEIEEKLGLAKNKEKDLFNKNVIENVVNEALREEKSDAATAEVELRNFEKHTSSNETSFSYSATTHASMESHLNKTHNSTSKNDYSMEEILTSLEAVKPFIMTSDTPAILSVEEQNNNSPKTTIVNIQKSLVDNIFSSDEFLNQSKPPEIVGVIPKTPKDDKKFSSFGKKRCFQIGSSLEQKFDPDNVSVGSKSSRNSLGSTTNILDDEISDLDENMFTGSLSKGSTKKRPEVFNQLFGIHSYNPDEEENLFQPNRSVASLQSFDGRINEGMKKWDNVEELDSISFNSCGVRNRWVTGDASDTESLESSNIPVTQSPLVSITSEASQIRTAVKPQFKEEKSLESTDSGIAQDNHSDREKEREEEFGFDTPPPPPILDGISGADIKLTEPLRPVVNLPSETTAPPPPPVTPPPALADNQTTKEVTKLDNNRLKVTSRPIESEAELVDIDWQYQLPSPPKAFRDSSPTITINHESNSVSDFKDSVVTSPELFEKLKTLEDNQSEKDTVKSEAASVLSEEPLNTLSLEHLEKRKSLVYNRELATSLKMTDSVESSDKTAKAFPASSLTEFQTPYQVDNKPKQPPKPARTTSSHQTLPNFKITTYDVPKHQNITVFEDDTIRSNTHGTSRLQLGHSMENISFAKRPSIDEYKEKDYVFYKPNSFQTGSTSVSRSGSFSSDNKSPFKPVSRSKSTLALNKYQVGRRDDSNMSRSNSLFDVSGLQSLEVIKQIQNKLSTPTSSSENIYQTEKNQVLPQKAPPTVVIKQDYPQRSSETSSIESDKTLSAEPVKRYYYRGPPAVNMSTWSERPKIPVAVKEDEDYKLGNVNNISSKLIVNTINNNITSNNSIEIKSKITEPSRPVSINISSSNEQISQHSGNVVIKIGGPQHNSFIKNSDFNRFMAPAAYRNPLARINKNEEVSQKPHPLDVSRVPVVKSVELKKPYKEMQGSNTSITHLNQENDDYRSLHRYYEKSDSFAEKFKSAENLKNIEKQESNDGGKRVFRVGSFKPLENNSIPVVRGFKPSNSENRSSWNPSVAYGTLPAKPNFEKHYTTNQHVPFSQSTLRRTESSKIYNADQNSNDIIKPTVKEEKTIDSSDNHSYNSLPPTFAKSKIQVISPPPPPPQMPKVVLKKVSQEKSQSTNNTDPRDLLLESIRNFGGRKGLKVVNV